MSEPEPQETQAPRGLEVLRQHVLANKLDVGLWATRVCTIVFVIGYVVPVFGSAQNAYYKAIMANAATSALRLHQRMPRVSLTREFLAELLLEDSCHYLFFSLIFLYVAPVALVLFPIFLFAVLHSASYSLILLDTLGQNSWWGARLMISLVEFQSRNILRLVSFTEIMIMPLTLILILVGRASLLTLFFYYQFLTMRYSSRRNPYTRNMFNELKTAAERFASKPAMPGILRKATYTVIAFVSRLAPAQQPQQ